MHSLRWLWIFACFVWLSLAIYAQGENCQNIDDAYIYHVERAGYLRGSGNYEGALANYQCAYLIDPESLPVIRGIGYTNIELGQLNTALPYFQTAMNLAPDDAISNFDLGRMIALQAERDIRNGVEYNELLSQLQQAVAYYNRAEELDPQLSVVYYNRGVAYYNVKNYAAAVRELRRAIELDVQPIYRTQFALATVYYEMNDYDAAWDYFQRTVINSEGRYTLEDVIPPGLSQYRTNSEIERFAKRNLPIVLFIIVSIATIAYVLIRRLRNNWGRTTSSETSLSSSPQTIIEPVEVVQVAPTIPPTESLPASPVDSNGFRWWQTVFFLPVIVGGLYALQRWFTGDES